MKETDISSLVCTIAPWLSVRNGARAVKGLAMLKNLDIRNNRD